MNDERIIDKDYFDRIRDCRVIRKKGNTYYLDCRLYKRGHKQVTYSRGNDFLMWGRYRYSLSETALGEIEKHADLFDERIRAIEAGDEPYCTVILENPGKIIYYKRNENGVFDWMQVGEDATYKFGKPWNTRELFRSMMTFDSMMEYKPDKLCNHPLYVAALFYDDELLKNELQVLFGENNEDAMAYMEAIDHIRRLPKLSEEYNKTFTLKTEDVDVEMLDKSGYEFLHRPYFAMQGCVHGLCELNPHARRYVDAGRKDADVISFEKYIAMFD